MREFGAVFVLGALSVGLAPAQAQTKLTFGYAPIAQNVNVFTAHGEGFFKQNGLETSMVALGPNAVPAIASGSVQIGHTPPGNYLQAVENGIDLVIVGGCGVVSPGEKSVALLSRTGLSVSSAKDLVGKRVGVPGIGGFLDVMFRRWLKQNGVEPSKLTFVEVPIPNTADVLKSGSIDAIVAGEPFVGRALAMQAGTVVSYFMADLPPGTPFTVYVTTRDWAKAHPKEIASFRKAIAQGASFVKSDPEKTQKLVAEYTKIPLEVMRNMTIPDCKPVVAPEQLTFLIETMWDQKMLQKPLDPASLIVPQQ
jgi:NitT/TauT family transport system substrate-binding protein